MIDTLFNPGSIAVIGASRNQEKIGYTVLRNLKETGFRGQIYPINKTADEILGFKCYPTVSDVGSKIDLAVIALPAKYAPEQVRECAKVGVDYIIAIPGGFSETGHEGKLLEEEIIGILKQSKTRLIGPNTVGVYFPHSGVNTALTPPDRVLFPPKGDIAFISQSGALGLLTMDSISEYGVGISAFVNLGNRIDLDEIELLEYFRTDDKTRSIVMYVENVTNGRPFYEKIKEINKVKPIVMLKAGRTQASAKAASLHTGAMATNDAVFDGALHQAGAVRAYDETELLDYGRALAYSKPLKGKNIAVVTTAGGVGVITTDYISSQTNGIGLSMANLSEATKQRIKEVIVPFGSAENPIDLTADGSVSDYEKVIGILMEDDGVDGIIVYALPQTPKMDKSVVEVIERFAEREKPIIVGVIGSRMGKEILIGLEKKKVPAFPSVQRTVKAVRALYDYSTYIERRRLH